LRISANHRGSDTLKTTKSLWSIGAILIELQGSLAAALVRHYLTHDVVSVEAEQWLDIRFGSAAIANQRLTW
jgi:hypothetical protein